MYASLAMDLASAADSASSAGIGDWAGAGSFEGEHAVAVQRNEIMRMSRVSLVGR